MRLTNSLVKQDQAFNLRNPTCLITEQSRQSLNHALDHPLLLLIAHVGEERQSHLPSRDPFSHQERFAFLTINPKMMRWWVMKTGLYSSLLQLLPKGFLFNTFWQ